MKSTINCAGAKTGKAFATLASRRRPSGDGRPDGHQPINPSTHQPINPSYELAPLDGRSLTTASSGSQLRTLFYAEDLGKHCRKLEREAKLAIEETGANMLYLVFGLLEFPEAPDSEKVYRAPLLCVPIVITKTEAGP